MKTKLRLPKHLASAGLLAAAGLTLSAAPFFLPVTYQGRLDHAGLPTDGSYELQVGLFSATSGGSPAQLLTNNIVVSSGLFTTVLQLDGSELQNATTDWLELGVRTNGSAAAFTILTPRQELTYAPRAARADVAGLATDFPEGAVSSYHISDGSIQAQDIGTGEVVQSVNGLKDAVTLAAGGGITISPAGNTLTISNSGWRLNGNAGTTAGAHFLGTTDNQPLEFRVNNQRRLQFDTNANVIAGNTFNQAGPTGVNLSGILSGIDNQIRATSSGAVIVGGSENAITNGVDAVIGGGRHNYARGFGATVSGGVDNSARSDRATVAGGAGNEAGWDSSFVGGGSENSAQNGAAAIVGGKLNTNRSAYGFIGAGQSNAIAVANAATVAGGEANSVGYAADYGTIPGGYANAVNGAYGFAAGRRAQANHAGAFVWADAQDASFASSATNQFLIRASRGVGINNNNPTAALHVGGTAGVDGIRFPDGTLQTTAAAASPLGFTTGAAVTPTSIVAFLSPPTTVTLTRPGRIQVTSHCAFGSSVAGGAHNLNLQIAYRPSGGATTTVGGGVLGLTAAQNQRHLYGLSGLTPLLGAGTYDVGLAGSSSSANWNNNEWCYTTAVVY
ncbi:MAG: hypothetical protein IT579_01800 [Verrucomicrobia subdivision 3 bacterium]|nr:hypothetical protein [Limisphaerales bacterium]